MEATNEKNNQLSISHNWSKFNSFHIMNGEWEFKTLEPSNEKKDKEEKNLFIKDGTVSEILNSIGGKKVIGKIQNFHCNLDSKEIVFYLNTQYIKNSNCESHFYILNFTAGDNPFQYLRGNEDIGRIVEFVKVD